MTRQVYVLLGVRSLPYAVPCLRSLVRNSTEPLRLTLITDNPEDADLLRGDTANSLEGSGDVAVAVYSKPDVDSIANLTLADYPHIRGFRNGHPCWRKLVDPFLLDGEPERIVIDPDVCFPNRFRFETTPQKGVLLMYQPPNCLFPPEAVRATFDAGIPLADHTDIGIAQVRMPIDWAWFDRTLALMGERGALPAAFMHVESILWAAWAMEFGGGYLDPSTWKCWHNAYWKRLARKAGAAPETLLRSETFDTYRCFHGGGLAKQWFTTLDNKPLNPNPADLTAATAIKPFEEYTRAKFERVWRIKRLLGRAG